MRTIVSGMIAADPHQGGATWAVLQYLLGFQALGHEVYFVEPISNRSLQPDGSSLSESINARYFQDVVSRFGFRDSATLLQTETRQTIGLSYIELREVASRADVLVNISGILAIDESFRSIPVRIYLDLDPAFIQLWQTQGIDMRFDGHSHFVTIGRRIGRDDCSVPQCGLEWITTFQPVVLSHWPAATNLVPDALTTIGNWRAYGSITHAGVFYGQKAHSLRRLIALPRSTDAKFHLAMAIHPDEQSDIAALAENGWRLLNPLEMAGNPENYQRFIQGSWAEFGISKSGYTASRCGWFSDRSICYLASGRPVIAADTGFADDLPTGEGLFAFRSEEDVLDSIESLRRDYERHSRAARRIAETYFDSNVVLSSLLERVRRKAAVS
jgi:hypothetical protein